MFLQKSVLLSLAFPVHAAAAAHVNWSRFWAASWNSASKLDRNGRLYTSLDHFLAGPNELVDSAHSADFGEYRDFIEEDGGVVREDGEVVLAESARVHIATGKYTVARFRQLVEQGDGKVEFAKGSWVKVFPEEGVVVVGREAVNWDARDVEEREA